MSKIFKGIDSAIDVGTDVIAILQALQERDKRLLEDLAAALTGQEMSADLKAALTESQEQRLRKFFGKLEDEVDLNDHFKTLLSPVSTLKEDNPLSWTWSRSPNKALPTAGNLSFSLGGTMKAAAEIIPGPGYRFEGKLGVSGSAVAPFRFVSLETAANVSEFGRLTCQFDHPANTLLLRAMAEDLSVLDDLNELNALVAPFASATLETQGEIKLAASVAAGRTFTVERGSDARALGARANVSAGYEIDWAKSAHYRLVVSREGNAIRVKVREAHRHESARTLSIGAEVKFSNVSESVAPLMKEISGFAAPVEKFIKKYAHPSKVLKTELTERASASTTSVQKLAELITGERKADTFVKDVIAVISEEADTRFDDYEALLAGETDDLINRVLARLDVPDSDTEEKLRTWLNKLANDAIKGVRKTLQQEIRDLLSKNGKVVTESLSDFVDDVDNLANKLDTRAKQLLEPVERAVLRYREIEESLGDAIEAIEKEKLTINFARSVSREDKEELLIDLTLNQADATTRRWYRDMLKGDFSAVLRAAQGRLDNRVTLNDCVYSRVFERNTTAGVTINLFGLGEIGVSKILNRKLTIQAKNGQIVLAEADADVTDINTFFGERRSVKLGSLLNLLDAQAQQENALQVHAAYIDENLKRKELKKHLEALEERTLIAQGATSRAIEAYKAEKIAGEVQITTVFGLDVTDIASIADMSEQRIRNAALTAVADSLLAYGEYHSHLISIRQQTGTDDLAKAIGSFRGMRFNDIFHEIGGAGLMDRKAHRKAQLIKQVNDSIEDLIEYFSLWTRLRDGKLPKIKPNGKLNDTQFERLEALNDQLIEQLDNWAMASGVIREFSGAAFSPYTLAFMTTLRALTGRSEPLVPIISWKVDGRTRRVAVV